MFWSSFGFCLALQKLLNQIAAMCVYVVLCDQESNFVTFVDLVVTCQFESSLSKRWENLLLVALVHGSRHNCLKFFANENFLNTFTGVVRDGI